MILMNSSLRAFTLALALGLGLGACKRSETPKAENSKPEKAGTSSSANAVEFKIKWPTGNRYVYQLDVQQNGKTIIQQRPQPFVQELKFTQTYALSVLETRPDGGVEMAMEFLSQEMEVKNGDQVVIDFDSKISTAEDARNPFAAPFRKMIGLPLKYSLLADGKAHQIHKFNEWVETVTTGAQPQGKAMFQQTYNEDYFRQVVDQTQGLPTKPVKVGDSWNSRIDIPSGQMGPSTMELVSTFKGWEERGNRRCAALVYSGQIKNESGRQTPMGRLVLQEGKVSGLGWFDPELGAMVETLAEQTLILRIESDKATGTNSVTQKIQVKLLELGKTAK